MTRPPVAIVHDYLTQRGGAERVVLALHQAFPDARVYTSLYDRDATFPEFADVDIRASSLNHVGALRRNHRAALPFLATTFSAMHIDADVAICSSSGWAHGARTTGRKIVYCHAPARWLYQSGVYLESASVMTRRGFRAMQPALTRWDRAAARTADAYLANSRYTRDMIRTTYGRDAKVVWPPHGVATDGPERDIEGLDPGYFLCVSRLLAYKHVDAILEAFRACPGEQLVVVGSGPEAATLRTVAPPNVRFLKSVTDVELRSLYAHAAGLIAASYEDFGLTPVEAAAFGTPTVALRYGGYLDTVIEGTTGVFFDAPEAHLISSAVRELNATTFDRNKITEHARQFGLDRFKDQMRALVEMASDAAATR